MKKSISKVVGTTIAGFVLLTWFGYSIVIPNLPIPDEWKQEVIIGSKVIFTNTWNAFAKAIGIAGEGSFIDLSLEVPTTTEAQNSASESNSGESGTNTSTTQGNAVTGMSEATGTQVLNGMTVNVPDWTFESMPNYYISIGFSGLDKSTFGKAGTISYGELDDLGRTTTAKGALTFSNVEGSYGVRQKFTEEDDPSGWVGNAVDSNGKAIKYSIEWLDNKVYNGYFWNRSHLIADSLGGEAERVNVITGTRPQNVGGTDNNGGMRYAEKKAQEWIESNKKGVLYYQVQPVYSGSELIPRYVVVSMLSSDGAIDEMIIVYNTANGYNIDYNTGEFHKI